MAAESAVVTGALGAVLGYLGGDVAEVAHFERLLWPRRFYHDWTPGVAVRQCLFLTMGGPVHSAALKTLDVFRKHGLYLGRGFGHLLGTAFYPDSMAKYSTGLRVPDGVALPGADAKGGLGVGAQERGDEGIDRRRRAESKTKTDEARNAFWVEVSRRVKHAAQLRAAMPRLDAEDAADNDGAIRIRAVQVLHHVTLQAVGDNEVPPHGTVRVCEDATTWRVVAGILCSEAVSITAAVVLATREAWGMFAYMLVPLTLKFVALLATVDREPLEPLARLQGGRDELPAALVFEIMDPEQDFLVIEGPAPLVKQFFLHYGHPLRRGAQGRARELVCMAVVYIFVLYFPAGLIGNVFTDQGVQYLWLAYQLYAVLAMHVVRLTGWQGCGRTEERAARALSAGGTAWLESLGGATVKATLRTTFVPNAASGKDMVKALTKGVASS